MIIVQVYARPNGTIAHVWDGDYGAPENGATLVARFDFSTYRALYQQLADNVKALRYTNGAIVQGENVILSSAWIAARETELTTLANNQSADSSERATLLAQAAAALTQIANDKTALQNALSVLDLKPILLNVLNRQEREIKALRAILRSGL